MTTAVTRAQLDAHVLVPEDTSYLALELHSKIRLPFALCCDQARTWLTSADITAGVHEDDDGHLVLTMRSSTAVDQVIDHLLQPWIDEEAAGRLRDGLDACCLDAQVTTDGPDSLVLAFGHTGNLMSAVEMCVLLGADGIADGLDLTDPQDLAVMAKSMRLVLIGLTGRDVVVERQDACVHADAQLQVSLTAGQALQLANRLRTAPKPPAQRGGQGADASPTPPGIQLNLTEHYVLHGIAEGRNTQAIAADYHYHEKTVLETTDALREKLGVRERASIPARARTLGLLYPGGVRSPHLPIPGTGHNAQEGIANT
ncbi:helix-turn-helix transcriptional regulator [Streptomyces rhizosphaericus]|uniref:helix-turn-helix transcriptional regulator n=1 Tax=Streptomyces rhizosphaericus TaxID=114699 RepID=UPI00363ACB56